MQTSQALTQTTTDIKINLKHDQICVNICTDFRTLTYIY